LTPRLRYLAELAARADRRTVTNFVEGMIEQGINGVRLRDGNADLRQLTFVLWDPLESDRFVKLALRLPELLTHEEHILWKYIVECDALWSLDRAQRRMNTLGAEAEDAFNFPLLRDAWDAFKQVAAGEADPRTLPQQRPETAQPQGAVLESPFHRPVAVRRASGQA
jgi:hypothetical protein